LNTHKFLQPKTEESHTVVIAVGSFASHGFIAGGSAAATKNKDTAIIHAAVEMSTHAQAFHRSQKLKINPNKMTIITFQT